MLVLVLYVSFSFFKHVQSNTYRPWSTKIKQLPAMGLVHTAEFVRHLERDVTRYIQICLKDQKMCYNSSLSLGNEVHKWPIDTRADISSMMQDIKRSVISEAKSLASGNGCTDNSQSQSMFSLLQSSIQMEIDKRTSEQIDSKTQDLKEEIRLLTEANKNLQTEVKSLKSNFESTIQDLREEINKTIQQEMDKKVIKSNLVSLTACILGDDYKRSQSDYGDLRKFEHVLMFSDIRNIIGVNDLSSFTNDGKFTCEENGLYLITITFLTNTTFGRVGIYKNGALMTATFSYDGNARLAVSCTAVASMKLRLGDKVWVQVDQTEIFVYFAYFPETCITVVKVA